jgi:hypothetical protein
VKYNTLLPAALVFLTIMIIITVQALSNFTKSRNIYDLSIALFLLLVLSPITLFLHYDVNYLKYVLLWYVLVSIPSLIAVFKMFVLISRKKPNLNPQICVLYLILFLYCLALLIVTLLTSNKILGEIELPWWVIYAIFSIAQILYSSVSLYVRISDKSSEYKICESVLYPAF